MDDIFLGELPQETNTGTPQGGYDSSGVNPDLEVKEEVVEETVTSSNNWIMYLGVGIMAYVLLFKKK
jgi:hypothetical protein